MATRRTRPKGADTVSGSTWSATLKGSLLGTSFNQNAFELAVVLAISRY